MPNGFSSKSGWQMVEEIMSSGDRTPAKIVEDIDEGYRVMERASDMFSDQARKLLRNSHKNFEDWRLEYWDAFRIDMPWHIDETLKNQIFDYQLMCLKLQDEGFPRPGQSEQWIQWYDLGKDIERLPIQPDVPPIPDVSEVPYGPPLPPVQPGKSGSKTGVLTWLVILGGTFVCAALAD